MSSSNTRTCDITTRSRITRPGVVREKIIVIGLSGFDVVHVQDPVTGVWTLFWTSPGAGAVHGIEGCAGGQIIAVSGGAAYHYEDDAWTTKTLPGSSAAIRLHAANRSYNSVWAITYGSGVYYSSRWLGSGAWEGLKTCCADVQQIWAASATEAWAVGGSAYIMHTIDGGTTWTNVRAQADTEAGPLYSCIVLGVWGWSANEVYFLARGWLGSNTRDNKLFGWDGSRFYEITLNTTALNPQPPGGYPPATTFCYKESGTWNHNAHCDRIWGVTSAHLVLAGLHTEQGLWCNWTRDESDVVERVRAGQPTGWGGSPSIRGLPDNSRIVQIPSTGTTGRESLDGGATWQAPDASFPSSTGKAIGLVGF